MGETDDDEKGKTCADMLKNTASNIRRLVDEIQQCEGRKKYLADTKSPSDGGDVRWYFRKVPMEKNEVAAAVPRSEMVEKGDYFRFGMRDSLAIEASFLQQEEKLLSIWWKEYAECSEGPKGSPASSSKSDPLLKPFQLENPLAEKQNICEEERVGVPVKGGLYEVDLVRRHCFPVYWDGDNRRVLRGHWFARKGSLDWLPLREDVSEQLEFAYHGKVWHRRTFQPSGLFAARVDMQGSSPGLHGLFTGDDDTWEAWLNVDASGISSIVKFGGKGIKLRRGYAPSKSLKPTQDELRQQKEEQIDDYCSQVQVRHLVFMVHGIGQRLEKANLVDDVGMFRHITASLAEQHLTSYQRRTQRILFIPCQWRKNLKLSGESAVDKCTLPGVRGLRVTLSATVHDVLYYMSPIYCQDIIDSVSNQLNKLYLKFLKRNPGYDGKVSLYGHSLGSVLSYDILCHQETLTSPFPMEWIYKDKIKYESCTLNDMKSSGHNSQGNNFNDIVTMDAKKLDSAPLDQVGLGVDRGQSEPASGNEDDSDGCKIMDGGVSACGLNQIDEDNIQHNENTTITSLREEIDRLNARIKELESNNTEVESESISEGSSSHKNETLKSYTPVIKYTKLEFKVDTFFAVGSPLGVFLSLRNVRIGIGKGKDYWDNENIIEEMPSCRQMFNIFHPFDPVAYRVEPLVCRDYFNTRPVIIPYHKGGKRLHIGFQEFVEDVASSSQGVMDRMSLVKGKVMALCQVQPKDDDIVGGGSEETSEKPEVLERSYGSIMLETLTGSEDGRIDHVLQDKTFQHQYISAVGAHTSYWKDLDTALFVLKHLYRDIADEPEGPDEFMENEQSPGISYLNGWYDNAELLDEEELPLTFSNNMSVKRFTRRAKSFIGP